MDIDVSALGTLIVGSFALSLLHALIPSHWLPVITIGKAERWPLKRILLVGGLAGLFHTLSTSLLGIFIGLGGLSLSEKSETLARLVSSGVLAAMGLIYLVLHFAHTGHAHAHLEASVTRKSRSAWGITVSLMAAMFFSPCLEIEVFYLTAGAQGATGIAVVAVTHTLVTVAAMLVLVYLGTHGLSRLRFTAFDHHERLITGITLLVLALANLLIQF